MAAVRPPVLAGTWYAAGPTELRAQVREYLAGADLDQCPAGVPLIVLVPHAGYRYSGAVAGKVVGLLIGCRPEAVFILAPSHRAALPRPALSSLDAFATPLGEVPVASDIVKALVAGGAYEINDRAHAFEHAIEIQLPLLQCALPPGTPIVPILVPHLDRQRRREAARALDPWRDPRHLFLVSSDMTHYGADYGYIPFTSDVPNRLARLDTGALHKFLARDAEGLLAYAEATGITMCGLEAAAVAVDATLPPGTESSLVAYARSFDQTGDSDLSVSYAAAMITSPAAPTPELLTAAERTFLVDLARAAVTAAVLEQPAPDPTTLAAKAGLTLSTRLTTLRGAFVTLTLDGQLRGCIGTIEGRQRLVDAVVDGGKNAAIGDPRFTPVRPQELPRLHVEVSALGPLREVGGPADIEVGRHGIMLGKGRRKAVFLPQVAVEQGWDLAATLEHLALKAGLPADAWRQDCRFQVFEAEICEAGGGDPGGPRPT